MGGGAHKPDTPPDPAPTPTPVIGREQEEAKKKVKQRQGGRASTIFAGRLNEQRNNTNILKTRLG